MILENENELMLSCEGEKIERKRKRAEEDAAAWKREEEDAAAWHADAVEEVSLDHRNLTHNLT